MSDAILCDHCSKPSNNGGEGWLIVLQRRGFAAGMFGNPVAITSERADFCSAECLTGWLNNGQRNLLTLLRDADPRALGS